MEQKQEDRRFTIGELAQMCGVTVRTLQYYDRSGLLRASLTEGGRRVYTRGDLFRLQQILFLKSLGFPLEQIGGHLLSENDPEKIAELFRRQSAILQEQIENLNERLAMLKMAEIEARQSHGVSLEKIMAILHLMKESNPYLFVMRYFSGEQIQSLSERFSSKENYREFMEPASRVFAELGRLSAEHADPAGPQAQKLAQDWWTMVQNFSGGSGRMLSTLISAGDDLDRWPKETGDTREMIRTLLSPALQIYFKTNHISIDNLKEGES